MSPDAPLLSVDGLVKSFGGFRALDVLSFAETDDRFGDTGLGSEGLKVAVPAGAGGGALPDVGSEVVQNDGVFGAERGDGLGIAFVEGVEPLLYHVGYVGFRRGEDRAGDK